MRYLRGMRYKTRVMIDKATTARVDNQGTVQFIELKKEVQYIGPYIVDGGYAMIDETMIIL